MQSVLQKNPLLVVPFLTNSLLGNDLPLGLKLLVLEWLMEAVKQLGSGSGTGTSAQQRGGELGGATGPLDVLMNISNSELSCEDDPNNNMKGLLVFYSVSLRIW